MTVKVIVNGERVKLVSPYHPNLPKAAKAIGGKFDGTDKSWSFDVRDEERVKSLARDIYGTDGSEPTDLVTVRVTLHGFSSYDGGSIWKFGRELARRPFRDSDVRLGDGVILVAGEFPRSGGSRQYPALFNKSEQTAVLEVRDVPRSLVIENEDVEIVEERAASESITIALAGEALGHLEHLRKQLNLTDAEIVTRALAVLGGQHAS